MADTTLSLQEYCASLDNSCLPKILQVCSGVYFQGSIYEISGSEVCFSTGDLIKVIALELQSVSCEYINKNEKFELPISHTGLFKVVPDQMPYSSVDEMMKLRPIGLESSLPFTFTSHTKIPIGDFILHPGRELTVKSIQRLDDGTEHVRCHIRGQQDASAEVCIPLATRGEFYECESEECFSLTEIMSSSCLRSRRFRFINTTKCQQPLLLSPVYQVSAIMNLRKNVLKFPSSLEVDVVDITDVCHADFVTPLNLTEILSQPDDAFPAVMEILEGPGSHAMFKCSWLSGLKEHNKLIFHKKGSAGLVLISNLKSRKTQKYFLVSQQYGGSFKRRPREFSSVYEVYAASVNATCLKVSVTRNCEEIEEEGVPALSVGEQLEIVRCERIELPDKNEGKEKPTVEALVCKRLADVDDDDEQDEASKDEIFLPMYMQCHFVEILTDNKRYKLKDLAKEFSLPLDIKVVSKDSDLESDPLASFPNLRIEEAMIEPVIQASFPSSPYQCFEIPCKWLFMSVYFTKEGLPWPNDQSPKCLIDTVTEVTDMFLYEFRKQATSDVAPPPRPPKRIQTTSKSIKKTKKKKSKNQAGNLVAKELSDLTLGGKKRPPAPPPPEAIGGEHPPALPPKPPAVVTTGKAQPNTYVKIRESNKNAPLNSAPDMDSDHDYETVEDSYTEGTTHILLSTPSVHY